MTIRVEVLDSGSVEVLRFNNGSCRTKNFTSLDDAIKEIESLTRREYREMVQFEKDYKNEENAL